MCEIVDSSPSARQEDPVPVFYTDRLTLRVFTHYLLWRLRHSSGRMGLLDPPEGGIIESLLIRCVRPEQESFFTGSLRRGDGPVVLIEARAQGVELSQQRADKVCERGFYGKVACRQFPKKVVANIVARHLQFSIEYCVLRLYVAEVLTNGTGGSCVVLHPREPVRKSWLAAADIGIGFRICQGLGWRRLEGLARMIHRMLKDLKRVRFGAPECSDRDCLIVFSEETPIPDKALRCDPFLSCYFSRKQRAEVVVYRAGLQVKEHPNFQKHGISGAKLALPERYPLSFREKVFWKLLVVGWMGAFVSLTHYSSVASTVIHFLRYLSRASDTVSVITCEGAKGAVSPLTPNAEFVSLTLIARELGVRTYAYQVSCIGILGPWMKLQIDRFFCFGPFFREKWASGPWGITQGQSVGYTFSELFAGAADRSRVTRKTLDALGVKFVVSYFDESCSNTNYGLFSSDSEKSIIDALARWVLKEPEVAVIIKGQARSKFLENSNPDTKLIREALSTGRMVDLFHSDGHRNRVLPAEAGAISDVIIGHSIGMTACLEGMLCGAKAAYLNAPLFEPQRGAVPLEALHLDIDSLIEKLEIFRANPYEEVEWLVHTVNDKQVEPQDAGTCERIVEAIEHDLNFGAASVEL